jgi:hypothetical protein
MACVMVQSFSSSRGEDMSPLSLAKTAEPLPVVAMTHVREHWKCLQGTRPRVAVDAGH